MAAEIESWQDGLPPELQEIRDLLFGDEAQILVQLRTELEQTLKNIDDAYEELEELQNQVLTRLDEYEQIILEDLPNIRDLSSSGNPFQGIETASIKVGTKTRTVQVGFVIDQDKMEQQKEELDGMRTGFADYQDAFIQHADLLDTKLQRLDEILFESEQSFSSLMGRYNRINSDLVNYMERFIEFQQESSKASRANLVDMQQMLVMGDDGRPEAERRREVIRSLMNRTTASLSDSELQNWNNLRIALINLLLDAQGSEVDYLDEANIDDQQQLFVDTGLELWWYLPNNGWELSIELVDKRIASAIESFHDNGGSFCDSWVNATVISDTVFERKADLYYLLYEIYDQLAVYGSGNMANRRNDTGKKPVDKGVSVTTYFEGKRDEINPYLQFPEITMINAELQSQNPYSAFFSGDFTATHPVGVVEYAFRLQSGGDFSFPPWKSVGTTQNVNDAYFAFSPAFNLPGEYYNNPGNYYFYLRSRGAGGLTIERQGGFNLEFYNSEEDAGPFISNLDISDDSPPTKPVVSLAESKTSKPQELYAQWGASDYQSGIQRYEYAIGTYSSPGNSETNVGDRGFYLEGFGSVLEPVVGMAETAENITDIVPWTDAGGRTEIIIKNLDLQHGYEYVVSVRATNGVGQRSIGTSEPILVDLTPPENLQINEYVQETVDGYLNSVKFELTRAIEKETEVVAHYVALGSSPSSDDIYPWTMIFFDFGRIGNVPVPEDKPIYLSIKAVNSVGLQSEVSEELKFRYNDNSAPEIPMVVTNPQQSSSDYPWIAIGWNGVNDPESGIVSYSYGLSSTRTNESVFEPDILGWVEVDLSEGPYLVNQSIGGGTMLMTGDENTEHQTSNVQTTSSGGQVSNIGGVSITTTVDMDILHTEYQVLRGDLNLSGQVCAVVKVTNGAGLSSVSYSLPIIYDQSPPEYADISAEPKQYRTDQLECILSAGDQESGIEAYSYNIVKVQDGLKLTRATKWINIDSPLSGDLTIPIKLKEFPPPGLEYGGVYKLSLWVRNRCGLSLSAGTVVIELVDPDTSKDIKLPAYRRLQ